MLALPGQTGADRAAEAMSHRWTPTEFVTYIRGYRLLVWVNMAGWCWRLYWGHRTLAGERDRYLTADDAKKAALKAVKRHR